MKVHEGAVQLSATDLANFLACRHLTRLDLARAHGSLELPPSSVIEIETLRERRLRHERAYLEHLVAGGAEVIELPVATDLNEAFEQTVAAVHAGHDIITQATLRGGRWTGRADILRRVPQPSALGDWSYEVIDTKLARETRGGTILQLCLYSELLGAAQGQTPEAMHVVSPGSAFEPESFRVHEFSAYCRLVKRRLEEAVDSQGDTPTYPDPVQHCDICRWWPLCDRRRRNDDHLCLVAGVSKLQTRELQRHGIGTLEALGSTPVPLPFRPERGAMEGYERVREQARIQLKGRTAGHPVHEILLPIEPGRGLARLPEPSPGDVFLDLEGDPFVADGGLEYLFGWVIADDQTEPRYSCRWATSRGAERAAIEGGEPPESVDERQRRVQELVAALTWDVPVGPSDRSDEQQGKWLLAHLLDWHRRGRKRRGGSSSVSGISRTRNYSRNGRRFLAWNSWGESAEPTKRPSINTVTYTRTPAFARVTKSISRRRSALERCQASTSLHALSTLRRPRRWRSCIPWRSSHSISSMRRNLRTRLPAR